MTTITQAELERRLGLGHVDDQEIFSALLKILNRAEYVSENQVDFTRSETSAISLVYDKRNNITAIVPREGLTTELLEQIEREVTGKLLTEPVPMIHRISIFANRPTEGYWRYKDKAVLRRAPDNAPRPFFLLAPHPLVLEVAFSGATDGFVRNERAHRESRKFALLLSLLVQGLAAPRSTTWKNMWGVEMTPESTGDPRTMLVQEYYAIPEFNMFADTLSDQGELPDIELVRSLPHAIGTNEVLMLPASLPNQLDIFTQLNKEDRRKILRAAYWLNHAHEVWNLSMSASYQALIQAVEVLIEIPKNQSTCPECDRTIGVGPTKLFVDFVDRFAPRTDREENRARKLLYRLRSNLTHGNALMYADEEVGIGGQGPLWVAERQLADDAHDICRRAVIGWLESREAPQI